jgi:hypothetical protein
MKDKQERPGIYAVETPAKKVAAPRKPNLFLRMAAFLLTVALMLGAVTLVVYRDRVSFDALRRRLTYRALERSDSGQAESFYYDGSAKDCFVAVGNKLLVSSGAGIHLYSGSGTQYAAHQAVLESPVAQAAGAFALVYSAGGRSLFVYQDKEDEVLALNETAGDIISARVNALGYLAVTTRASGYKGSATIYDRSLIPVLQLNLSSSFLTDALVSSDGKNLAAITMGQGESGFQSTLALYALGRTADQTAPDAICPLGGNLVLDLAEDTAGYWALGDLSLTLANHSGALVGSYDYGGRYLKEFSLNGDNFAALLLGKYRAGTVADLVVVDGRGTATATLAVDEQVLSLSAAGRYVAVLTADRLDLYTADLTPYATLSGTQGARKVLLRPDGSALLIGSGTARLYIPG